MIKLGIDSPRHLMPRKAARTRRMERRARSLMDTRLGELGADAIQNLYHNRQSCGTTVLMTDAERKYRGLAKVATTIARPAHIAGMTPDAKICCAFQPAPRANPPRRGPMIEPTRPIPRQNPTPVERILVG
jgi:hypothetical protein